VRWAALVVGALSTTRALASDPLNSSDKVPANPQAPSGTRTEFNVLPVVGGTTDIGFGGGYFVGLVGVRRGYDPYEWNIESDGLVTFKAKEGGGILLPYQDVSVTLTVPRFLGAPLHFEVRPSYSYESTLNYYGIGNASSAATPRGSLDSYHEYTRVHPELLFKLRGRIVDHVAWRIGLRYVQTWVDVNANSRLAEDLRSASAEVKSLLGSMNPHAVVAFQYGLQFDNRDNDVSTHSGSYESVDVRLIPGGIDPLPYRYGRGMATTRVFIPIWKPRITLALRAVGDWLVGSPPFYELSTFDTTYAIGGQNGVRGVPAQRYYGKIKAFGNVELRTQVASFHALGKPFIFGVVAFVDGGRVWTDVKPHPELDGTGVGLKYGVGGGLRLQSGPAFVLRADVAWSPDATPVGGYFAAGEMF
jgi:outer membrane protein assembly factor BamA